MYSQCTLPAPPAHACTHPLCPSAHGFTCTHTLMHQCTSMHRRAHLHTPHAAPCISSCTPCAPHLPSTLQARFAAQQAAINAGMEEALKAHLAEREPLLQRRWEAVVVVVVIGAHLRVQYMGVIKTVKTLKKCTLEGGSRCCSAGGRQEAVIVAVRQWRWWSTWHI